MKKISLVVSVIFFAALAMSLLYFPNKTGWMIVPLVAIGGILLYFVWPRNIPKVVTKNTEFPDAELNRIGIWVGVGATVLLVYELFTQSGTFWSSPGLFVLMFIIVYGVLATKQKYTLVEYLTMKARDEREQSIIDSAARKTYAFFRLLVIVVVLILLSGIIDIAGISLVQAGYGVLVMLFVADMFFRHSLKRISR